MKIGELNDGEAYFRKLSSCLYRKDAGRGVLLHEDGRNPVGSNYAVHPATTVARPLFSVKDGWIIASHPDKPDVSYTLMKAADGVPDAPKCLVSHLPAGTIFHGYGPYGTTSTYRVDPTVKGSYSVNVTHLGTGKQLLANSQTEVQGIIAGTSVARRVGETKPAAPAPSVRVTVKQPPAFTPRPGELITGRTSRTRYWVYSSGNGLRLMDAKTFADFGAVPLVGLDSSVWEREQTPLPHAYAPAVQDLVLYKGGVYRVVYVASGSCDLRGLTDEHAYVSPAELIPVKSADITVTV